MRKVLVPIADGFEEIETVTIVDVLRRAGVEVVLAGTHEGPLTGSRKVGLVPDTTLDGMNAEGWDAVVLPGGQPGVDHLRADPRVLEIVRGMHARKGLIGAICAAPLILRDAGVAEGLNLTSHPSVRTEMAASRYVETRLAEDGLILTSRGPGTAMEFALQLVEKLVSKEKVLELKEAMLVSD